MAMAAAWASDENKFAIPSALEEGRRKRPSFFGDCPDLC
jgi:hypothetical protein